MSVIIKLFALLSQKIVGVLVAGTFFTFTVSNGVWPELNEQPQKLQEEKKIMLSARESMHEGVNDCIEVTGWDGQNYKASVELEFHKDAVGNYLVKQPKFFMVQMFSGIPFAFPALNMLDTNNEKIRYTCMAQASSKGDVNFTFTCSAPKSNESTQSSFIWLKTLGGDKWMVYIDSSYTQLNDTNVLLKFRLVKA